MKKPTKGAPRRRRVAKTPTPGVPAVPPRARPPSPPIVGIGASAGGLEALEQFLQAVPAASGLAFVVVQHIDPTRPCLMAELLRRVTPMTVAEIRDRTRVLPDCVYVIPPAKDLSILHGVLHLADPAAPRGLRLPIDGFFHSLADDAAERSIGVVLSGMGSDGTLGLRAIKARAGLVCVQDPATAKFDGMPRSAVDAGLADVVAPAGALPAAIIASLGRARSGPRSRVAVDDKGATGFERIVLLLRARTGHDFSHYRKSTVYRRVERRMGIHQLDRIADYVRYLQANPQEADLLFKELLIGVTRFFRDPATWEQLKAVVFPALLRDHPPGLVLRVWVPGCSTGEEAFSLAIVCREVMDALRPGAAPPVQIFATDLARDAVDRARAGVFPTSIAADVSPERLARFFAPVDRGYQVARSIRETVIFAPQNVVTDPPFTKLALVSCRNLLIYLEPALQRRLISLFHYGLNPGGYLLLGSSETVGEHTDLFTPIEGGARIYRRIDAGRRTTTRAFPASVPPPKSTAPDRPEPRPPAPDLATQVERLLLQRFAPAALLADGRGDVVYISGHTGRYLEPAVGKANWNLFDMARDGLRAPLSGAFREASRRRAAVMRLGVAVRQDVGVRPVDVTVEALDEPPALRGFVLVVFSDAAAIPARAPRRRTGGATSPRATVLGRRLEEAAAELHALREDMQRAREEAMSADEELQSANEELQSTNEELTTSKEEMQSMNEELETLNQELQARVDDLSTANNDLKNLLDRTDVATVFLDTGLRVRRFTTGSSRVLRLLPGDVGRPITDIALDVDYTTLADDAREVLRTLGVHECEAGRPGGPTYLVRVTPYRTVDDAVDGVAITFTDVTRAKALEAALSAANARLEREVAAQDVRLEASERARGGDEGERPPNRSAP